MGFFVVDFPFFFLVNNNLLTWISFCSLVDYTGAFDGEPIDSDPSAPYCCFGPLLPYDVIGYALGIEFNDKLVADDCLLRCDNVLLYICR